MDDQEQAEIHRPKFTRAKLPPILMQPMLEELLCTDPVAREVRMKPISRDFESVEALLTLYRNWCFNYNIHRALEERSTRLDIFHKNAVFIFEMNKTDPLTPSCQFYLSSSCDEKDLLEPSGDEERTLKCTVKDLESDEAVWDLYYRWCLFHKILRTREEMQKRFNNFKMSAYYAVKMNLKDPSSNPCLSIWCDKIELRYLSDVEEMTLTPIEKDLESDEALQNLYHRWRLHHKIDRTPEEMTLAFSSFKKSATEAFGMSQKDPTVQFCLSIWCDETDICFDEVKLIPTERDLKSGNALLGLYRRYRLYYKIRRTRREIKERFSNFVNSVYLVFKMNSRDPSCQFFLSSYCDEKDKLDRAAIKVSIRPKFRDLGSDEAVQALYNRWCLHYNIRRALEERDMRLGIFHMNAIHVFEMNNMDSSVPSCQFHLSSSCDEKDLFDPSGDEERTLKCTVKDLESDEAVWDLYYRWCLYHTLLRIPEEMEQRFSNFKMSAFYAVKMNQKGPSSNSGLSMWCDKIDLRYPSGVEEMTLAPTKRDMESDEALWDLYHRWLSHHKIQRTTEEMKLAFKSFKKIAAHAFDMSQKDPTVQFCLSIWCDETDICFHGVRLIPTERDLKSGNALLDLYHRYCREYWIYRDPEEMQHRFYNFKKNVNHVFEKNIKDPYHPFYLSNCCDEKDIMLDEAAMEICIIPTFKDLASDKAVLDLYRRWCIEPDTPWTNEEMLQRLDIFKMRALKVFKRNIERPGTQALLCECDA